MNEKYNTRVRQAISDEYVKCSKERQTKFVEHELAKSDLNLKKHELSYADYIKLQEHCNILGKEIERLSTQLDIWDKAREICLNIADETTKKKERI